MHSYAGCSDGRWTHLEDDLALEALEMAFHRRTRRKDWPIIPTAACSFLREPGPPTAFTADRVHE